jgi:hypothetical protein
MAFLFLVREKIFPREGEKTEVLFIFAKTKPFWVGCTKNGI